MKYVDLLGVTYHASTMATGFGSHLAIPLLRNLIPEDKDYVKVDEQQVSKAVEDSMRVLFYRDARSGENYSVVIIKIDENTGELNFQFIKDAKVQNQSWKFAGILEDMVVHNNRVISIRDLNLLFQLSCRIFFL